MPLMIRFLIPCLLGFILTSLSVVVLRNHILNLSCDPKFECLCSLSCLAFPMIISTLVFSIAFMLSYKLSGKNSFHDIKKNQKYTLVVTGVFLGLLAFAHPLITIVIIFGGYFTIWLAVCVVVSFGVLHLCKKLQQQ